MGFDKDKNDDRNIKALVWLSGGHFVNDIYTGLLNPIMPFIAAKLAFSMAFATVIMSIAQIFSNLLQPLFGFFADRFHKRFFIFWGLLMSSMFISFAPGSPNIYFLIFFIIFGSLGSSFFHPQALGVVTHFAGNTAAKALGVFLSMGTLGYAFGPIFSAYVAQYWGFEKMPVLAIFGISWALLMFAMLPKFSIITACTRVATFKQTVGDILANNELRILIIISMLKTLINNSCAILLPFLWKSMGCSPFYIGVALFLFIFAGGIGSLIRRNAEQILGTRNIFYFSMISTLPLMILFIMTYKTMPILSIAVFALMGMFTMMAFPVTMYLAQNVLPEYKSVISGFINGFSWGIVAIFMTLIGFSAQNFGITKVLLIVAIIPAACSPLVRLLNVSKEPA